MTSRPKAGFFDAASATGTRCNSTIDVVIRRAKMLIVTSRRSGIVFRMDFPSRQAIDFEMSQHAYPARPVDLRQSRRKLSRCSRVIRWLLDCSVGSNAHLVARSLMADLKG